MVETRVELSRQTVGDAAVELLESEGPEAVTGTRIAEVLGVSQPALYRHIDGMPDVQFRGMPW